MNQTAVIERAESPLRFAVWLDRPDWLFCDAVSTVGVDAVIIDREHGAFSNESVWDLIGLFRASGISTLVRVPELSRVNIMQPLDWGADAVIIPGIREPEEVARAVDYASYPPTGSRGWGPRRVQSHASALRDRAAHLTAEMQQPRVWAQIETAPAVSAIEGILAIPGLAGVLVGPMDLSGEVASLGATDDEAMTRAIDRTVSAAARLGVPVGVVEPSASPDRLQTRVDSGCSFVSVGTQLGMIHDAVSRRVGKVKKDVRWTPPTVDRGSLKIPSESTIRQELK